MKNLLIILWCIISTSVYSQKRYYNVKELTELQKAERTALENKVYYRAHGDVYNGSDTLFTDTGCFYFLPHGSPLSYFENSLTLIDPEGSLVHPFFGGAGDWDFYHVSWTVKNGKLFIKGIYPEHKYPNEQAYKKAEKEAEKKLEKFTGREFTGKGLLDADWATGVFFVCNISSCLGGDVVDCPMDFDPDSLELYFIRFEKGRFIAKTRMEKEENKAKSILKSVWGENYQIK